MFAGSECDQADLATTREANRCCQPKVHEAIAGRLRARSAQKPSRGQLAARPERDEGRYAGSHSCA